MTGIKKKELQRDPYVQDIIERNLQVAAQTVLDISNMLSNKAMMLWGRRLREESMETFSET